MRIATFNVNGVRSRLHQISRLVSDYQPDIIALQEIKCVNDAFPVKDTEAMGYHASIYGQKGHYGVAFLSKTEPVSVQLGFPSDGEDAQRRMIAATWLDEEKRPFTIINGYFPQGESRDHPQKFPAKQKFFADLLSYLNSNFKTSDNVLIVGDFNVAPKDADVGIGPVNARRWVSAGKCAFLPEEREWLEALLSWGTSDIFREMHPDETGCLSWFDYRSAGFDDDPKRGLRLDLLLGTEPLKKRCTEAVIALDIRAMEKPSDHAPVLITLK